MAFGESMAQAVFFIASVIVALGVVAVLTASVNSMSSSFLGKAGGLSEQIKTGVKVTGDSCYYGGSNFVYVKNVGQSVLDANSSDIYVDGAAYTVSAINTYYNNAWIPYSTLSNWSPGQVVRFTLTSALSTSYHRIRFVTQYGTYDTFEYSDC